MDQRGDSRQATEADERVILEGRYEIFPQQPLPDLDSPGVPAFHVTDMTGLSRPLFALICSTEHCPRIDAIPVLLRSAALQMIMPVKADVVYWPPAEGRRAVLLFEQPVGKRLMSQDDERFKPWREDEIVDGVLESLVPSLKDMSDRFITHRAIRPNNMFFASNSGRELIMGECVSAQAGFHQSTASEPIDSAMCMPGGRGDGVSGDDLYALGFLILVLVEGGNPVTDLSDDEIIERKISKGSYATLTSAMRSSLPMGDLVRGLLCDDPDERWTVDDLILWLNGRHLTPKQPVLARKAARAYNFMGQPYTTSAGLSYALGRHWREALECVRDGTVERWIRRSLADETVTDAYDLALETAAAEASDADNEHIMLSMILIALDRNAPIRFREFSARVDGMHKAFALSFQDPHINSLYLAAIKGRLAHFWFRVQPTARPEFIHLRRVLDAARRMMVRMAAGCAAEQILYMTNPGWACQSPLFGSDYVSEMKEVLEALDRVVASGNFQGEPVDSHVIAFCAANHKRLPEAIIMGLTQDSDPSDRALFILQLFGEVQRNFGPPGVPSLVRYAEGLVGPVIETYHNRATRERLRENLPKLVEAGSVLNLLYLVDDIATREEDKTGFQQAQNRFGFLSQHIAWVRAGGFNDPAFIKKVSRPVASVISAIAAGVAVLTMAMLYAA